MRKFLFGFAAALVGTVFFITEVEAKRLGGARSLGAQRSITNPPPAKPAQQQAAPAATQAQPAAAGGSRWMPILGGLAIGGALGWLMGANGLGGLMVGIMLAALLVFGAMMVFRMLAARRGDAQQPVRMQYAGGMGNETVAAPPPSQSAGFDAPHQQSMPHQPHVPAGFDVAGFLRGAKLNFMKLQAANDSGNLDELREFTAPDLFEELRREVESRPGLRQQTDILSLNADLLEVATEGERHWASVRFAGTVRETPASAPVGFEEVWNLSKPVDGSSGWLLSGIQQMH